MDQRSPVNDGDTQLMALSKSDVLKILRKNYLLVGFKVNENLHFKAHYNLM